MFSYFLDLFNMAYDKGFTFGDMKDVISRSVSNENNALLIASPYVGGG